MEKPKESKLGDAKSIIKGFGPGDPKVGGDGDDAYQTHLTSEYSSL